MNSGLSSKKTSFFIANGPLFILQNIAELWVDIKKYSLPILDSKFPEIWLKSRRLSISCFGFTHLCAFVNVALSYESD